MSEEQNPSKPSVEPGPGGTPAPAPSRGPRISTPVLVGLIAGALVIVSFAVAIMRTAGGGGETAPTFAGGEPAPRSGSDEGLRLLSPVGTVPHGTLELHWTPLPGATGYEAAIIDNRAIPVWRSDRIQETSVTVPEAGMKRITSGPVFFWSVTGYLEDGTEVVSGSSRFVVAE